MQEFQVLLTPEVNYTYSYYFELEEKFDPYRSSEWILKHWHLSLYISTAYLVAIFLGKGWMSNRPRWELRKALVLWNVIMAVFSTVGAFRTIPELFLVLESFGIRYSICNATFYMKDNVVGFWYFLFAFSKIFELIDTAFIVLRKQKLIFLHWYHHASVLILTWYFYASITSLGRWFVTMNYFVHSLMYTYYALKALKIKVPRPVSMFVTAIQITQTVLGSYLIIYSGVAWLMKEECQVNGDVVVLALILYGTNFALFAQLFYTSYLNPPKRIDKSE